MRSFFAVCLFAAAASAAPAAEADPALLYAGGLLPAHGLGLLPHAAAVGNLGVVAPAVYKTAEVKSVVEQPAEVKVDTVAHTVPVVGAYHAPLYHGAGVHYLGKREAEAEADAEADPWTLYSRYYGGYPYARYGYGYPYAHPLAYRAYNWW